MRSFNEFTITDAVLERVAGPSSDRTPTITDARVRSRWSVSRLRRGCRHQGHFDPGLNEIPSDSTADSIADSTVMNQPYWQPNYDFSLESELKAVRAA